MQNETPQQPAPPQTIAKQRKFSKKLIIILTILLLTGIGIILFSGQSSQPEKNKTLSKSILNNPAVIKIAEKLPIPKITLVPITPDISPIPSNENTAFTTQDPYTPAQAQSENWRIYNNTDLNFTINYPPGYKVNENSHGLGVSDIVFTNPDNTNSIDYQMLIYPKTIGKLIGQDFDVLYDLPALVTQRMTMSGQENTPQQFTKIENMTLVGLRAFKFKTTSDPPAPDVEAEIGVYIEIGDSTVVISTKESNKANLDQMLSTFQNS